MKTLCVCVQVKNSTNSSVEPEEMVMFPQELYRQTFNASVSPAGFCEAAAKSVLGGHTRESLTSIFTLRLRTNWPWQLRS